MKPALALGCLGYPLAELLLTLKIASWLGALPTFALLLLGVAAGMSLLRGQRLSIMARLRLGFAAGDPLLPELLDGALRAAAAVLLILPGFISDAAALVLLIPAARRRLVGRMASGFARRPGAAVVIDGEYRRLDDPAVAKPRRGPGCC